MTLTEKNHRSIERRLEGLRIIRQQPGFSPQKGACVKVKKAFCFVSDVGGFRNRDALCRPIGTTFEILT